MHRNYGPKHIKSNLTHFLSNLTHFSVQGFGLSAFRMPNPLIRETLNPSSEDLYRHLMLPGDEVSSFRLDTLTDAPPQLGAC